jgi:hypothetical protein
VASIDCSIVSRCDQIRLTLTLGARVAKRNVSNEQRFQFVSVESYSVDISESPVVGIEIKFAFAVGASIGFHRRDLDEPANWFVWNVESLWAFKSAIRTWSSVLASVIKANNAAVLRWPRPPVKIDDIRAVIFVATNVIDRIVNRLIKALTIVNLWPLIENWPRLWPVDLRVWSAN